jgi:hypothetical protein
MMEDSTTRHTMRRGTIRELLSRLCSGYAQSLCILLLAGTILLSGCGNSNNSSATQQSGTLSGNWQFSLVNTPDLTTSSGLQGGFLLQNINSVSGTVVYSNTLLTSTVGPCNGGPAAITGTINGQNAVTLTAVAGAQTYTLTGTLSSNGSTMTGTYTATAGPNVGTTSAPIICGEGTSQTGPQTWSAVLVPPLSGIVTGTFHSASTSQSSFPNQDFQVSGGLTQGANIGASSATITGNLNFTNYPCIPAGTASVNGQISGNTVVLQLIATNGANIGQIGIAANESSSTSAQSVTFNSTTNGYVLSSSSGTAYVVNSPTCPLSTSTNNEDTGYICLALNSTTACQQPITISPAILTFPPQLLGSTNPSTETVTLTNVQPNSALTGLTLTWLVPPDLNSDTGQTDFTNQPNFTESDNCAVPTGSPFNLAAGQSCTITISFAPQESCTWLPDNGGNAPDQCPLALSALLTVNNVPSVDNDQTFLVPVTGTGESFLQPSTPQLAFSAEAFGEASLPQQLFFTNYGVTPVQILPPAPCVNNILNQFHMLPHPLVYGSAVGGLQVVSNLRQDTNNSTIDYSCDYDPTTLAPNFQISQDTCSGTLLQPQDACSVEITFVPQSTTTYFSALAYFLELNTVQCVDPVNDPPSQSNPCEIDGGRFPVELTANLTSPIRMSPAAGLNFGTVPVGTSAPTQTITILNDPTLSPQQTVTLVGNVQVSGNYSESNNCPISLAPGASCTLTVKFKPSATGSRLGSLAINYTTSTNSTFQTQPVYLFGIGAAQ